MDSYQFHQQAVRVPRLAPEVSAAQIAALNDQQLGQLAREVNAWLAGLYVDTGTARTVMAHMEMTLDFNEYSLPGSKAIAGLSGPNGAGKSTLLHRWAARYYKNSIRQFPPGPVLHRWEPTPGVSADVIPVVWINLQANSKIAEVDGQILMFLRAGSTGTIRELTSRTVKAIARHHVRVLVIDDVHLLNTGSVHGRNVLDHLKHLNTELGEQGASLVLAGANLDDGALVSDMQIATRLRMQHLRPLSARTKTDIQEWDRLLGDVATQLAPGLADGSVDHVLEHSEHLHHLTAGYPGELINLLKYATINAVMLRTGRITRSCLDHAPLSHRATMATGREPS